MARLLEEAQGTGPRLLLPSVREVMVEVFDGRNFRELCKVLGRVGAFPGVKVLQCQIGLPVGGGGPSALRGLGDALAAGGFAALERLELELSNGHHAFSDILPGLAAAPCAGTLRAIKLHDEAGLIRSVELDALAVALRAGQFPALVELDLSRSPLRSLDLACLLSYFSAEAPLSLEVLHLNETRLGASDATVLAAALQEGRLGDRLRELVLWSPECALRDESISALRRAITWGRECVERLELLSVYTRDASLCQVEGLVYDAVKACSALKRLELSHRHLTYEEKRALQQNGGRRRGQGLWGAWF